MLLRLPSSSGMPGTALSTEALNGDITEARALRAVSLLRGGRSESRWPYVTLDWKPAPAGERESHISLIVYEATLDLCARLHVPLYFPMCC